MRLPGDVLFIAGGTLPLLYLTVMGLRHCKTEVVAEEFKETLFTDVVAQPEARR